jgi:hypothetical protein
MRVGKKHSSRSRGSGDFVYLVRIDSQRFLAQHMLPSGNGIETRLFVQRVRYTDVDNIYFIIGVQITVAPVCRRFLLLVGE